MTNPTALRIVWPSRPGWRPASSNRKEIMNRVRFGHEEVSEWVCFDEAGVVAHRRDQATDANKRDGDGAPAVRA